MISFELFNKYANDRHSSYYFSHDDNNDRQVINHVIQKNFLSNSMTCSPLQTYSPNSETEIVSPEEMSNRSCAIKSITMYNDDYDTLFRNKLDRALTKNVGLDNNLFGSASALKKNSFYDFKVLGAGAYGAVVHDREDSRLKNVVFKFSDEPLSIYHEAFVGMSSLNNLRRYIPNFMYVYSMSKSRVFNVDAPTKNIVVFSEKINGKTFGRYISDKQVPDSKILSYLIQIIYSLGMANKEFGFTHNDLHSDNIIIRDIEKDEFYINYSGDFVKTDKVATIIDYGYANVKYEGSTHFYQEQPYLFYKYSDIFRILGSVIRHRPAFIKCMKYFFKDPEVFSEKKGGKANQNFEVVYETITAGLYVPEFDKNYNYKEFAQFCQDMLSENLIYRISAIKNKELILSHSSSSLSFKNVFALDKTPISLDIIEFYDDYRLKKINLADMKHSLTNREYTKHKDILINYINSFAKGTSENNSHLTRGFDKEIEKIKSKVKKLNLEVKKLTVFNKNIYINYSAARLTRFEAEYKEIIPFVKGFNHIRMTIKQLVMISEDFGNFGKDRLDALNKSLADYTDKYSKIKKSIIETVEIYSPEILGNALNTDDATTKFLVSGTQYHVYDKKLRSLYSLIE